MLQQSHPQYNGFREPGIRLNEPLLPSIVSHRSDIELPRLYAIHLFDKAHTTMLIECGLISRKDGKAILQALRDMESNGVENTRLETGGGMHSGEKYLIRRLGEQVGGCIHLGRSSGDLGEVSTRIYIRDNLIKTLDGINKLRSTLIMIAKDHLDTVMPGYTHGQHAQPTTYGHYLLSCVATLERDFDRLWLAFEHNNTSPAGAAILTGSDFLLDRQSVATFLGFSGVEKNTIDAILSYDALFETVSTQAILHMNLARWAEDIMLWSSSEFGFLDVPDRFCGTSSIMMQKKNVYITQWVKGAAAETVGGLVTTLMADRAPTGLPILEHQYSRSAMTRSFDSLQRDLNLLTQLYPELKVEKNKMLESAGAQWAQATDVAGMLVREKGISWRTAHQIVGILVRLACERNIRPQEATVELLDEASSLYWGKPVNLDPSDLKEALDPALCVNRRLLYGGPARKEVLERMQEYEQLLSADENILEEARMNIEKGLATLENIIDRILS